MSLPYAEVFLEPPRPGIPHRPAEEIRVVQAEYSHEIAVITYRYHDTLRKACAIGQPVFIRWGWAPQISEFAGYVHHLNIDQKTECPPRRMHVICIGATQPLNNRGYAEHRNNTATGAVTAFAREYGFSVLREEHPYVWPIQKQNGESAWNYLVNLAKSIGWTLYPHGTDIRCHSRAIRTVGAVRLADYRGNYERTRDAVYNLDIIQAETLNDGGPTKRNRVLQADGFVVRSGIPNDLSGARIRRPQLTDYRGTDATSVAEAQVQAAAERELNRHHIRAKALVSGDARLHPTRAVHLIDVDPDHDGYWYTIRAEHILTGPRYRCKLELGKDSLGDIAVYLPGPHIKGDTAARPIVARGADINAANANQTAPKAVYLEDRRWKASSTSVRTMQPVNRPVPVSSKTAVVTPQFKVSR